MRTKRITTVVLSVVLFIVGFEFLLRLVGFLYLNKLYTTYEGHYTTNSENINIVCLGESSTAGIWVKPEDTYPAQLQKLLRKYYSNDAIHLIVPPHVGQNTSQVANRIDHYIDLYKPNLFILMLGYNNGWSLAESNLWKFFNQRDFDTFKLKVFIFLDQFRLFKISRYFYLKVFNVLEDKDFFKRNPNFFYGHPELTYDPPEWVHRVVKNNQEALIKLWQSDIRFIIQRIQEAHIPVILTTYHVNPTYLSVKHFQEMAEALTLPLVRNDILFDDLIEKDQAQDYLLDDNWHPNRKGYYLIAENISKKIVSTYTL